jgi:FKBP-type peptidyl-prolyl cis-trans isomerase
MERNKILQVLVPAGAAAAVVVLIGVLIALSDWGGSSAPSGKGKSGTAALDDAGMTDTLPPLDAPEWKPGPGQMLIWDVKEGEGEPCPRGASVTIHYTGWTKDGKVFDSSRANLSPRGGSGDPATFDLGGLIKGWQEGIPGMKPGGVRRLLIPYQWAYGERGSPPNIPPRADLVFEVKLLRHS